VRTFLRTLSLLCLALSFSSCAFVDKQHLVFTEREDHPKTYDVYRNKEVLDDKQAKASKIVVNLKTQRAKLYIGNYCAIDSPCTTGKSGKRTPTGSYTITEKIKTKRSSIFGRCYYGRRCVHRGDRRKCRRRYTRYVGAPLPYWMRVNNNGIGFHSSRGIRRYPSSNGCIRLPYSVSKEFYALTDKGTPVTIEKGS